MIVCWCLMLLVWDITADNSWNTSVTPESTTTLTQQFAEQQQQQQPSTLTQQFVPQPEQQPSTLTQQFVPQPEQQASEGSGEEEGDEREEDEGEEGKKRDSSEIILEGDAATRFEEFNKQLSAVEESAKQQSASLVQKLDATTWDYNDRKVAIEEKRDCILKGIDTTRLEYKKYEEAAKNDQTKLSAVEKLAGKAEKVASAFGTIVTQVKTVIDAEKNWQSRTVAGLEISKAIIGFLPTPLDKLGEAFVSIIASSVKASAPTPSEKDKWISTLTEKFGELLDKQAAKKAQGIIRKMDSNRKLLIMEAEKGKISDEEFTLALQVAGPDFSQEAVGWIAAEIREARLKNTLKEGRKVLEFAAVYADLAQAQYFLSRQILQLGYLAEKKREKAGISRSWIVNQMIITREFFKEDLGFYLQDCCLR